MDFQGVLKRRGLHAAPVPRDHGPALSSCQVLGKKNQQGKEGEKIK